MVRAVGVEASCVALTFGSSRGVREFEKVVSSHGAVFQEGRPWHGEPDLVCGTDEQILSVMRDFKSRWGDTYAFKVHAAGELKAFEVW